MPFGNVMGIPTGSSYTLWAHMPLGANVEMSYFYFLISSTNLSTNSSFSNSPKPDNR